MLNFYERFTAQPFFSTVQRGSETQTRDKILAYAVELTGTSANMHDVSETSKLIRKDDHVVYGNSGYLGAPMRDEIKDDEVLSKIEFRINKRPSSLKTADDFQGINWDKKMEHDWKLYL